MTDWFRSWHGAPTDIKWLAVARRANVAPGMVVSIAWALMDRASQAEERGSIEGYDAEELAIFYGYETEQVEAIVQAMEERGIVTQGRFTAWQRRQPKREDNSAERVRKFRERQKTAADGAKRTVTHVNAPEQSRTDTEQSKKESSLRSERARAKPPDKSPDPPPERLAFDAWNELAAECGLPHADVFDADRAGKIRARLKECGGLDGWKHALNRIRGSPFLLGQVDGKDFRAHLDFVLQKSSFRKLMEGTYDGNHTVSKPEKSAARAASDAAMARVFGGCEPGDNGTEPAAAGCAGNGRGPHWGTGNVVGPGTAEGNGGIAKTAVKPLPHAAHDRGGT